MDAQPRWDEQLARSFLEECVNMSESQAKHFMGGDAPTVWKDTERALRALLPSVTKVNIQAWNKSNTDPGAHLERYSRLLHLINTVMKVHGYSLAKPIWRNGDQSPFFRQLSYNGPNYHVCFFRNVGSFDEDSDVDINVGGVISPTVIWEITVLSRILYGKLPEEAFDCVFYGDAVLNIRLPPPLVDFYYRQNEKAIGSRRHNGVVVFQDFDDQRVAFIPLCPYPVMADFLASYFLELAKCSHLQESGLELVKRCVAATGARAPNSGASTPVGHGPQPSSAPVCSRDVSPQTFESTLHQVGKLAETNVQLYKYLLASLLGNDAGSSGPSSCEFHFQSAKLNFGAPESYIAATTLWYVVWLYQKHQRAGKSWETLLSLMRGFGKRLLFPAIENLIQALHHIDNLERIGVVHSRTLKRISKYVTRVLRAFGDYWTVSGGTKGVELAAYAQGELDRSITSLKGYSGNRFEERVRGLRNLVRVTVEGLLPPSPSKRFAPPPPSSPTSSTETTSSSWVSGERPFAGAITSRRRPRVRNQYRPLLVYKRV